MVLKKKSLSCVSSEERRFSMTISPPEREAKKVKIVEFGIKVYFS